MKTHAEYNGKVRSQRLADLGGAAGAATLRHADLTRTGARRIRGIHAFGRSRCTIRTSALGGSWTTAGPARTGTVHGDEIAAGGAAVAALVVLAASIVLSRGGASWPASVTTVQNQLTRACQNPTLTLSRARSISRAGSTHARFSGCSRC